MRPDLDAIRAQIAAANPGAQQIAEEFGVPVLLDYIQRLEAALDAIASGVIPPKPSPPGTMLVLSQTAQEFAYKTMQGVRGGG